MVQQVDLDPAALSTNPCLGMIKDWALRVAAYHEQSAGSGAIVEAQVEQETDITEKTVGQLLGQLKPGQLRALIAGCVAVLAAVFTLGATFGAG